MASTRHHLLAPLVLLLGLAACAPSAVGDDPSPDLGSPSASPSATEAAAFPLELTDDAGRSVRLEAHPQRIVSLAPSNTEIVCALDACDLLVGVTDFDAHPPEVADVPDVVIGAQVDVELVVEAEPDLVLAAGNELTPSAVITQLEALDLTVMVLYPETLDEVYATIELLGAALHAEERAADLTSTMEERVAAVEEAVAGADRPRTLYEVFYSEGTTFTAGEGSFLASMLEIAGAEPVIGDAQGGIGAEALVEADPQLILLGTASYDPALAEPQTALATLAARPGWADLTAVREGNVVPYLDDVVTTRPGPRIVDGLEALAHAIHPDRFE